LDEGRTLQANAADFRRQRQHRPHPNYTDSTAHGRLVNAATSTITDNGGSASTPATTVATKTAPTPAS
jgi:hypothetical protein